MRKGVGGNAQTQKDRKRIADRSREDGDDTNVKD